MRDIIIAIMNQFGYLGIMLLIAIENIFPPIPSEIILTFGGFLTTYTVLNPWGVVAAATVGSVAGALVLYGLGRTLHTQRLERFFASRLGRLLQLKKEDVQKAQSWFLQRGNGAVFFCRFVPIVRSLISIPAGAAQMPLGPFLGLTITGTFIWNLVLVFLGRAAGHAWEKIADYVDTYALIAAVLIAIAAALLIFVYIKKRFSAS